MKVLSEDPVRMITFGNSYENWIADFLIRTQNLNPCHADSPIMGVAFLLLFLVFLLVREYPNK